MTRKKQPARRNDYPLLMRAIAILAAIFGVLILAATYSHANAAPGSAAERAACTPDAFRLCLGAALSFNAHGVANCLIAHRRQLSPSCRNVLAAHHAI